MPPTEEFACENEDCELDMFENHYTYDLPDEFGTDDVSCPYCGGTETLRKIEV